MINGSDFGSVMIERGRQRWKREKPLKLPHPGPGKSIADTILKILWLPLLLITIPAMWIALLFDLMIERYMPFSQKHRNYLRYQRLEQENRDLREENRKLLLQVGRESEYR